MSHEKLAGCLNLVSTKLMFKDARHIIVLLSLLLVAGVMLISITGLTSPALYFRETPNWQAQSVGQDMVNVFLIVPVLLAGAILTYRGSRAGLMIWGGANLYLAYTFCLYCFDIHFNGLFFFYCINLGLAFYSFLYFIFLQINQPTITPSFNKPIYKITGYYFISIAVLFYALWLAEVIPAMLSNTIPPSLEAVGLPTNGVHVIDLSIFLPGLFIVGVMLLRKKKIGFMLVPVCLVFMILMDITIAGLMWILQLIGHESNMAVAGIMIVLAIISILLFAGNMKTIQPETETAST